MLTNEVCLYITKEICELKEYIEDIYFKRLQFIMTKDK